jgi:DNA invertase Pin-like site-specific DNA recombinase
MIGQRVGYVRVSSFDQNPERQLKDVDLDRTFSDKASGKDAKRPQLEALMTFVRAGDTVVVHSMDRLARNLDDLRQIVQTLTRRGIRIEFVKEHLAFTGEDSPMANLMLSVMGRSPSSSARSFANGNARGSLSPSTRRLSGRKRSLSDSEIADVQRRVQRGEKQSAFVAREYGISRETLYQYLRTES